MNRLWLAPLAVLLSACTSVPPSSSAGPKPGPPLEAGAFLKSEVDQIAEIHLEETLSHLRVLAEKLYRRNPREWRKAGHSSLENAVARLFASADSALFPELGGRRGVDCIYLTFREDYGGDRVLAFVWGLKTMTLQAYNDKRAFYFYDDLDPQKLYLAARNYEIAAWMLATKRDAQGQLFLLSNAINDQVRNLSFEREFGKLIAEHDVMARIVAGRSNRTIVRVVQSLATALLYPL